VFKIKENYFIDPKTLERVILWYIIILVIECLFYSVKILYRKN
jgi:hypothetical protein